jgi:hypothetical protein
MIFRHAIVGGAAIGLLAGVSWASETGSLSPEHPSQARRTEPVTYAVDFSVVVTAPYHTKRLTVWLPLPPSDDGQVLTEGEITTFPTHVEPTIETEPVFENRFAFFKFDQPAGGQLIRHRFHVKVWQQQWDLDPGRVEMPAEWPETFAPYLRSEAQAVVVDEPVRDLLAEIVPQRRGTIADWNDVLDWVGSNFAYDHTNASLAASSLHGATCQRGHCSDYHGFCAAMGRALGFPTRIVYGINPLPKNSPSHCKLEAFLPPYGWVTFDVSETQRLAARILEAPDLDAEGRERLVRRAIARLRGGFRDNTWFVQTRGTDYELAPPASRRVAVVRTIYAEADDVPLPEPDPADPTRREFSWMTIHRYEPDRPIAYPYDDWRDLAADASEAADR